MRWVWRILAALVLLPVLVVLAVVGGLNTGPGQRFAAREIGSLSGGMVVLTGLSGRFPDALRIGHLEIRDSAGAWLVADDAALDWSPLALLHKVARIDSLSAARIAALRAPQSSGGSSKPSSGGSLPVRVELRRLHVDRLELAAPLAGRPAVLALDGHAALDSAEAGEGALALRRLDAAGSYDLSGRADAASVQATLAVEEPAQGLISQAGGLPDLGAISAHVSLDGPWSRVAVQAAIAAGQLHAAAQGTIDAPGRAAELDVTASAPAMTPRPDVSWRSVSLDAHVHGRFTAPTATGTLRLEGLEAAGAGLGRLTADLSGDQGEARLKATAEGLRLPGPKPDLFAAAPLVLTADARLDTAGTPVRFTVAHPLLSARGTAHAGGSPGVDADLTLPDLAPLAAAGGADLHGRAQLHLTGTEQGDTTTAGLTGTLAVTGGMAPVPGLIGDAAKLDLTATLHGQDVTEAHATLDGSTLSLRADGGFAGGKLAADWQVALADLHVLAPSLAGHLGARGHAAGPLDAVSAQADLDGSVAASGLDSGPLHAHVEATGLPARPAGSVTASGELAGAPLALDLVANRDGDGTVYAKIARADWKSLHAEGEATLAPGAALPQGAMSLRMGRLAELRPFAGRDLTGSVDARASFTPDAAKVDADLRDAGLPGTATLGHATLTARIANPATHPVADAKLAIDGLRAGALAGSLRLDAAGPQEALGLRLSASVADLAGAPMQAEAGATLDVPASTLALARFQANWKGEALKLLGPARISYGGGVAVDRLRLGVRDAVLDVAGRVAPTLDLTASLSHVGADLARIAAPDLRAQGSLEAQAKLTGTPAAPRGTIRVSATGMKLATGPGAAMPAASLIANATLEGSSARIDANASAGRNLIHLFGTAPLDKSGKLDLRATGSIDLAVLDPITTASGRRVRGQVAIDASIGGTAQAPLPTGTVRLTGGEVQDYAQGARLDDIAMLLRADGDSIHIERLSARAGQGTITGQGSVDLAAPMPVNLALNFNQARPLASDRLTAVLNGDLTLRGELEGRLDLGGAIHVVRADIRIPETLPSQVPTLDVRRPGQAPPPPPAPGPEIGLDLALDAPGRIFVRGRGLDAELEGRLHIGGTTAAPQPVGSFKLRRGQFSLVSQTLTFTSGEVGFDGSGKIDPTLNFVATSSSASVTATLAITGYASAPKFTLSSTPPLPQDEVLAQLLFHQSVSQLGPLQLASIAAGLAQLAGVGGGGPGALDRVRQGLGLDRLSVNGATGTTGGNVEAGRYVAPGVYVGARQSTSGSGTQAVVQLDLTRGLKLESTVGTSQGAQSATGAASGAGGSSIGLTYQFNY
jgi:translocation and assembly module TamB